MYIYNISKLPISEAQNSAKMVLQRSDQKRDQEEVPLIELIDVSMTTSFGIARKIKVGSSPVIQPWAKQFICI